MAKATKLYGACCWSTVEKYSLTGYAKARAPEDRRIVSRAHRRRIEAVVAFNTEYEKALDIYISQ